MSATRLLAAGLVFAMVAAACANSADTSPSGASTLTSSGTPGGEDRGSQDVVVQVSDEASIDAQDLIVEPVVAPEGHAPSAVSKPIGEAVSVEHRHGTVVNELTISFTLQDDARRDESFSPFIAFLDEDIDQWTPVASTYDPETSVLSATVDHLSIWRPFAWDLNGFNDALVRRLADVITYTGIQNLTFTAPTCPDRLLLDKVNSIVLEGNTAVALVLTCLGHDNRTTAVIGMTNARPYAIETTIPQPAKRRGGGSLGSWNEFVVDIVQGFINDRELIPPSGTTFFEVPLDPQADLRVEFDIEFSTFGLVTDVALEAAKTLDPTGSIRVIEPTISCIWDALAPLAEDWPPALVDVTDLAISCLELTYAKAGMEIPLLLQFRSIIKNSNVFTQLAWDQFKRDIGPLGVLTFQYTHTPIVTSDCPSFGFKHSSARNGVHNGWGPGNIYDFDAGDHLTFSADFPVDNWEGTPPSIEVNVYDTGGNRIASDSSPFPGSVSYTVPTTGKYNLEWHTYGNAFWTVTCDVPG
jgi:hypothetical protein